MIEINSLGVDGGNKVLGLGILLSLSNFKGVSIILGKFVVNIGIRSFK